MRTVTKKLRKNRGGFTLAETLIAILILLMVSAIVGGAIPTASTVYKKTVDAANAQILLSTTLTELRDELSTASNIKVSDDTTVSYRNGSGYWQIVLVKEGTNSITIGEGAAATEKTVTPGIWLCRATAFDPETGEATYPDLANFGKDGTRLLVSEKASNENLAVSYSSIDTELDSDNNVIVTFNTITVGKTSDTNSLAERTSFTVRVVA